MFDIQRFMGTRSLSTVFDVGANIGQTTEQILRFAPATRIFSFEPYIGSYHLLVNKYKDHTNVCCVNAALGARDETRVMRLHKNSELNTFATGAEAAETSTTTAIVNVTTVDHVLERSKLSHLTLLKMDVQGWEMEVLKGAKNALQREDIMFVFAEVTFRRDTNEMQQFSPLHDHLGNNGFVLCGLYDQFRYGPRKEFVLFANALYLNPECRIKQTGDRTGWFEWLAQQGTEP